MNKHQVFLLLIIAICWLISWLSFVTFICDFFALGIFGWQWYVFSVAGMIGIFFQLTTTTPKQS
jgi:TRAP-type mannitol/chloroaromatic compound transport system permease small subunit